MPDIADDRFHDVLTEILGLLAERRITPLIAERIPLSDAARAHRLLEAGGVRGRLVLMAGDG